MPMRSERTPEADMCWRKRDFVFRNVTDKEYMADIHADVDKNTDMKVFIYDGKDTEPYTK